MTHLDFLRDWFDTVWIKGDLQSIDRYFAPSAGADGFMPDGQVTVEDFRALVPALLSLVRDLRIDIVRSVETGEWLWCQILARATAAQGIQDVTVAGQVMVRIVDGKIAEAYNCFDFVTFFEQAGLLPPDAFMLLLSGEKFG